MEWVALGLIAFIGLGIAGASVDPKKSPKAAAVRDVEKERLQALMKTADEICDFEVGRAFRSVHSFFLLADQSLTKFLYLTFDRDAQATKIVRFSSLDVVSMDVTEGASTTVIKQKGQSKTKGGLTRAAIGGVALGGAGAVVGAVTAKRETKGESTQTIHRGPVTIRIGLRNTENPLLTLRMMPAQADEWSAILNRASEL